MIMARTPVEGSAGYTAVEQVRGALHGREGSFVLQHYGIMADGEQRLILEIVPDSGTGELTGISGSMTIDAEDDLHCYILTYALGEKE
ncbi:MAG: DUF3224 domain-containing protein [Caldilineaceae bacterium]|nr:DUF3224 domain-containing protein [Caldilineaceae bacterium]